LNLTGEYRVASELTRRGLHATPTYGNAKGCDLYVIGPNRRAVVVEVKTTQRTTWMTGFYRTYRTSEQEAPDIWVLVRLMDGEPDRFYVLTHQEMAVAATSRLLPYWRRWAERTDTPMPDAPAWGDYSSIILSKRWVDDLAEAAVTDHLERWDKVTKICSSPEPL
jgi:hypothetical protein